MTKVNKSEVFKKISEDISACEQCRALDGVGDTPVFPRGNLDAICMLVGEGPGEQEERRQKPFVGAAGRLLEDTLKGLGFNTERDFYITNIVKYRSFKMLPSGEKANKPPTVKQANIEREFLEREIAAMKPRLIVALGAKASQWFLGKEFKLTRDHGKFYNWHGINVLPTYHPAAVLRARAIGDGQMMQEFKEDLRKIKEVVKPGIAA